MTITTDWGGRAHQAREIVLRDESGGVARVRFLEATTKGVHSAVPHPLSVKPMVLSVSRRLPPTINVD